MRPVFNKMTEGDLVISGWRRIVRKMQTLWVHEHVPNAHTFGEAVAIMRAFNTWK